MVENNSSLRELIELAEKLTLGREFFTGQVVERLRQASEVYPYNQIIRAMELAFEGKLRKQGTSSIVSQKEIQECYDQVCGLGNKFQAREELKDLLLTSTAEVKANHENLDHVLGLRGREEAFDYLPQEQVSELAGVLWNDPDHNVKKRSFLENGRRGIQIELESFGFSDAAVEVADHTEHFVIYTAEVDTPKGKFSFFIPAEIKAGSVLMPSVLVAGNEFLDLNPENIKLSSTNSSVKKSSSPKSIINTLNRLTNKATVSASSAEFKAPLVGQEFFAPQFTETKGHNIIDVRAEAPPMPAALAGLTESSIKETLLEAGLSYPRDIVLRAKQVLSNELKLAQVPHDKINIQSEFNGGIILATNVAGRGGKKKIEVPMEIKNNEVLLPSHFTSGVFAAPWEEKALKAFAARTDGADFDSVLNYKYDMSFKDLHKFALKKAAYGDFIEATEALTIINDKFGAEYHRIAHNDLMDLLKAGYQEDDKPLSALDKFVIEASRKAQDKENHIKINANSMLLYPKE